jgi:hypothetical protein
MMNLENPASQNTAFSFATIDRARTAHVISSKKLLAEKEEEEQGEGEEFGREIR